MNKFTIEEYYIRLLVSYGQDEKSYRKSAWQDEQRLPLEFTAYIYSDDFLEMLNRDIASWYEELINNIKSSEAYTVLKGKIKERTTSDTIYEHLNEINSHIIEVYEYQKCQNKKLASLKENAILLKEGIVGQQYTQSENMSLKEVNKVMAELDASYNSLQRQRQEVRQMKKKLGYLIKKPFYCMGLLETDNKEEILEEQIQVLEDKINIFKQIKDELQQRYEAVEQAIEVVQKEVLTPQVIGELTNIQQQLLLTNDAILKQIARPLLRKIHQNCGMPVPKGLYRFKLYIELWILYHFKGPVSDEHLKGIKFDIDEGQRILPNEYMLIQKI